MPIFVANGPNVPDDLVQDLGRRPRSSLLRVPAYRWERVCLDYNGLVRKVYDVAGTSAPSKRDKAWLWPDRMLGELERRLQPGVVRNEVAQELARAPTSLVIHQALPRLRKAQWS